MNLLKRHWRIASLVVVGIAVFAAFRFKGSEQPKYFTAKVDRGNISQVVEATGTINAVTTVQVVRRFRARFRGSMRISIRG